MQEFKKFYQRYIYIIKNEVKGGVNYLDKLLRMSDMGNSKIPKRSSDEQSREQIFQIVIEALKRHSSIHVTFYHRGTEHSIVGSIQRIEMKTQTLTVLSRFEQLHTIEFTSIMQLTLID